MLTARTTQPAAGRTPGRAYTPSGSGHAAFRLGDDSLAEDYLVLVL